MIGFCSSVGGQKLQTAPGSRSVCVSRRSVVRSMADEPVVWAGQDLSKNTAALTTLEGPNEILKKLPHRFPFLLVDKVVAETEGESIVGVKNVTFNEPQFTGHFPENPIMPGVLMIEALAQLSGLLILKPPMVDEGEEIKGFFFGGINNVRFRKPVMPGDTLVMEARYLSMKKKFGIAKCATRGFVDGVLAVEAELTLTLVK